jgi:hypothetical protein
MSDIKAQPYAEWLEASLRQLVDLHPRAIGIITIMPDGTTGTHYYNYDLRDLTIMREAIIIDYLAELVEVNAD